MRLRISVREGVALLLSAALLVGLGFLLNARVSENRDFQEILAREQLLLQQAEGRLQSLLAVKDEAPYYRQKLASLQGLVPDELGESQLLYYFQEQLAGSGLLLQDLDFGSRRPAQGYQEIPVSLSLEGDFWALLGLLERLREEGIILRVDDIRIDRAGPGPRLAVSLEVCAFSREGG